MSRNRNLLVIAFAEFGTLTFASRPCKECTEEEIGLFAREAKESGCDAVIGMGGGKVIDTAKMVAYRLDKAMIIFPTVASSDAPCSSLSIIYKGDGSVSSVECMDRHPDLVVVDSEIIAKAPTRMLACGIGDALSTFYEARTCREAEFPNAFGCRAPETGFGIAKLCLDTVYADGIKALVDCGKQEVTPALEHIIEANTLMSAVGFENCGVSCAHALQDALSSLKDCKGYYHGEFVAFGTICHLTAEGRHPAEIETVREFCCLVGLPITLGQVGLTENVVEKLRSVKHIMCPVGDVAHCVPRYVTPESFLDAVLEADREGAKYISARK